MKDQPEKLCSLNLDALRFEELGRSPVTGSQQLRIDPALTVVPAPRSPRSGSAVDRELHRTSFSNDKL